ncbi:MAG: ATP-binding protein [Gluconacetobacter sp.]|nr:ATP-binding protein [Gluconacetobacter dulcium]
MFKILVTGAYSTGKSSLVDAITRSLRAADHSVTILPDVARDCPFPLNLDQTERATLWLLTTQIAREIEASYKTTEIIICDRGVPDILAHFTELATRGTVDLIPRMMPFLNAWIKLYDLILLSRLNPDIPIEADGLRCMDPDYRSYLDRNAARGLEGYNNTIELPFDEQERLCCALKEIGQRLP